MLRSFVGTLAALAVVRAVEAGHVAAAWWMVAGVAIVALLELVVGLVRRRVSAPGRAPRSAS